jgi:hypothetical protein
MPYYRSAVDPSFDTKGTRDYRPNYNADRSFDESQELITRKYLAYFTEKDPKKRAELLRDYNQTRNRVSRAMSGRREDASHLLDAPSGPGADRRRPSTAARDDQGLNRDKPRSASRFSASGEAGRRPASGAIPPAPVLPGMGTSGRTTPRRTPREVLDRSRRFDRGATPSAGAPAAAGATTGTQPLPTPPE